MTDDELIEIAIQGHASTRDAIRYAIQQEREACARVCDEFAANDKLSNYYAVAARAIRERGNT